MRKVAAITFCILIAFLIGCTSSAVTPEYIRTDNEINSVFEAHKERIFAIYRNFLLRETELSGKVVYKVSVNPSGVVRDCKIYQSNINGYILPELIKDHILKMNFGVVPGGEIFTFLYPIEFFSPNAKWDNENFGEGKILAN